MHINSALNLVLPAKYSEVEVEVEKPDPEDATKTIKRKELRLEPMVRAYHTPIGREVFEANHRVLTATYTALWSKGLRNAAAAAASGSATLLLKDVANADAAEWGLDVSSGPALLAEIRRLTFIIAPTASGFEPMPVDYALASKIIDAEDWIEVESAIVFFTCSLWGTPRATREQLAPKYASAVLASITSSELTAFVDSLKTSTTAETSEPSAASSVPV